MSKAVESLIMSIMDGNEGTYGKSGAPFTFQSGWQAADSDDMVCDLNVRYQTTAEWFEVYSKLRSFLERRLSEGDTVYIGVWRNPANGLTYIDRSYHFDSLGSALEFAECEGQLEIWDWTRSRSYTVEELKAGMGKVRVIDPPESDEEYELPSVRVDESGLVHVKTGGLGPLGVKDLIRALFEYI